MRIDAYITLIANLFESDYEIVQGLEILINYVTFNFINRETQCRLRIFSIQHILIELYLFLFVAFKLEFSGNELRIAVSVCGGIFILKFFLYSGIECVAAVFYISEAEFLQASERETFKPIKFYR